MQLQAVRKSARCRYESEAQLKKRKRKQFIARLAALPFAQWADRAALASPQEQVNLRGVANRLETLGVKIDGLTRALNAAPLVSVLIVGESERGPFVHCVTKRLESHEDRGELPVQGPIKAGAWVVVLGDADLLMLCIGRDLQSGDVGSNGPIARLSRDAHVGECIGWVLRRRKVS